MENKERMDKCMAVDVKGRKLLALKITDERTGDSEEFVSLVKEVGSRGKVKKVLADGGYDPGTSTIWQ